MSSIGSLPGEELFLEFWIFVIMQFMAITKKKKKSISFFFFYWNLGITAFVYVHLGFPGPSVVWARNYTNLIVSISEI